MSSIKELKDQLVTGCRALGTEEWVKGTGHLSVRIPDSDLFLMPRLIGLASVKEEDIWTFNMKGEKIEGGSGETPSEIPIHYCIYRSRPDVKSICHVHAHNAVLLSLVGETIKPLIIGGADRYPKGIPVFQRPGLILTEELGDAVARILGASKAVVLRGHGVVVVGQDIIDCVTSTVGLEETAQFQAEALMIGKPRYYTQEEIEEIRETFKISERKSPRWKRGWEYLLSRMR